jgi:hypothetical protein
MTDSLYRVRVSYEFIAYAHNSGEAEDMAWESMKDFNLKDCAIQAERMRTMGGTYPMPSRWDRKCLVYGGGEKTLGELIDEEKAYIESLKK